MTKIQVRRRRKIIEAGLKVLEQEKKLNLDRVIKLSGGSKGAIYDLFGNKSGFEQAIREEVFQRTQKLINRLGDELGLLSKGSRADQQVVTEGVGNALKLLNASKARATLRLLFQNPKLYESALPRLQRDGLDVLVDQLGGFMVSGARNSKRPLPCPEAAGQLLFAMIFSPVLLQHFFSRSADRLKPDQIEVHARSLAQLLVEGVPLS